MFYTLAECILYASVFICSDKYIPMDKIKIQLSLSQKAIPSYLNIEQDL